jgi:4,5-dihydroxyphthalate decarboxylase
MLDKGEIDALMMPHPPKEALRSGGNIRRLFVEPKLEEARYFRKNGFYPIMHVVAFKDDVLAEYPELAKSVMIAFDRAKEACTEYYDDPNWSRFIWGRHLFEEEREIFGEDPWPNGVRRNRTNLERFMGYSLDQRLLDKKLAVEELFAASTLDS